MLQPVSGRQLHFELYFPFSRRSSNLRNGGSLKALEEKGALLRRVGARAGERLAVAYNDEVSGYDRNVETIREPLVENQRLQVREEAQAKSG